MDTAKSIQSLVDAIGRVAGMHPECTSAAGFACRAIAASAGRALLPEKVSASARMSVATSAMSFVAQFLDGNEPVSEAAPVLAGIVREAVGLAPLCVPEHESAVLTAAPPSGWAGPPGGPFVKTSVDGARMTVSRRPLLPGGDWTFFYGGLPASFGETPAAAAARAHVLEGLFSAAPGQPLLSISRLHEKDSLS